MVEPWWVGLFVKAHTTDSSMQDLPESCPTGITVCTKYPNLSIVWLQDVYKPESARLRRHLSAVINFAKFREEKLVAYT